MTPEQIKEVFNYSVNIRGTVLSKTVHIERLMDQYLAEYFCETEKKRLQISELWLWTERATFDLKRQILSKIIPNGNEDFLTSLEEIAPHRNVFAHLEVNVERLSDFFTLNQIVFKSFSNGKKKDKIYTVETIKNLEKSMEKSIEGLKRLLLATPPRS